jgi:AraC-like DNA-binding protein
LSKSPSDTLGEEGLDLLFLHRDSLMRDMFFGWSAAPLAPDHVSYAEMAAALEPLMRDNLFYQMLGFEGESLERLIQETWDWMALDRELHGDALRFFRVVRRAGQEGIAGFTLNVPITETTLPLLRRESMGAVYEAGCGPLELRENTRAYFSLRLVADGLDSFSALLRTVFVEMASRSFDVLLTALPWQDLPEVLETMGFDTLAREVAYEGYEYDVVQLDVERRGGAVNWLFRLVREDLGLPPRSLLQDWDLFKQVLQEALASLHDSFVVLAKSPLIDEFALVERTADDWTRAEALTQALQDTLETMRLPEAHDRPDADFHILNERYGVVDEAWRRFEFSGSRPSMKEIAQTFNCSRRALYNRLDEALEMFARAFRREIVKH